MESTKYNNQGIISLCPVESDHEKFLFKLFKDCRPDLSFINGLSEEQKENIIFHQFQMEQQQLVQMYPEAELNVIMHDEEPIGRIYIYKGETLHRILQIGLLEGYRGKGFGKNILLSVIADALNEGKSVKLQVAWFNQSAYEFYKNLGFKVIENNGIFYEMKYVI